MIDELLRQVADSFAQERSEDDRLEICLTVFGREHLMLESVSVRPAKAIAIPHVADDDPVYDLRPTKKRVELRIINPLKV